MRLRLTSAGVEGRRVAAEGADRQAGRHAAGGIGWCVCELLADPTAGSRCAVSFGWARVQSRGA